MALRHTIVNWVIILGFIFGTAIFLAKKLKDSLTKQKEEKLNKK